MKEIRSLVGLRQSHDGIRKFLGGTLPITGTNTILRLVAARIQKNKTNAVVQCQTMDAARSADDNK